MNKDEKREKDRYEIGKSIGYLKGFYDGQLMEIKKQIALGKMTPEQKFRIHQRQFFKLFKS